VTQYYIKKSVYKLRIRLPKVQKAHLNTFPAVHLQKLDSVDFTVKFSSELAMLSIAGVVVLLNAYFFVFHSIDEHSDTSELARVLSFHPEENPKLYARHTTIKTVVGSNLAFISSARADSFEGITAGYSGEQVADEEEFANPDVLAQPSPDSVSGLIAKQIKVHETKEGENLKSIAAQYGISPQTIAWANRLPDTTIKPGWFLVILPTDGVLHKATSNDTLPDIAKRYGVPIDTIISYNGLESAEDIDKDQLIIVPDGKIAAPKPVQQQSAPVTSKRNDGKVKPQGTVAPKIVNNGSGHIFPWGYCTWYVATRTHVPWGGNAKNWLANSKSYGAIVSNDPASGSIVVTTDNARYGHVAYVEKVEDDRILVSEMNYEKFGKVNQRWISRSSKSIRGYIHP
jgi:surface antigen